MSAASSLGAVVVCFVLVIAGIWLLGAGAVTTEHSGIIVSRYPDPLVFGLFGTVYHIVVRNGSALTDVKVGSTIYYGLPDGATYNWSTTDHPYALVGFILLVIGLLLPLQILGKEMYWGRDL